MNVETIVLFTKDVTWEKGPRSRATTCIDPTCIAACMMACTFQLLRHDMYTVVLMLKPCLLIASYLLYKDYVNYAYLIL